MTRVSRVIYVYTRTRESENPEHLQVTSFAKSPRRENNSRISLREIFIHGNVFRETAVLINFIQVARYSGRPGYRPGLLNSMTHMSANRSENKRRRTRFVLRDRSNFYRNSFPISWKTSSSFPSDIIDN